MRDKALTGLMRAGSAAVKAMPAKTAGLGALGFVAAAVGFFALVPSRNADESVTGPTVDVPAAVVLPQAAVPQPAKPATIINASSEHETGFSAPDDRVSLTRKLQSALKHADCYKGPVNGAWNPQTRRAMKAFTERVNAVLPVDRPDDVLLALLDVHQDTTCANECKDGSAGADCRRDGQVAAVSESDAMRAPVTAQAEPAPEPVVAANQTSDAGASSMETATVTGASTSAAETPAPAETDAANIAAVAPLAAAATAAAAPPQSSEPLPQRVIKRSGPTPSVGIYERKRKRQVRRQKTPSQIAKSFVKSVQKAFASAFNP